MNILPLHKRFALLFFKSKLYPRDFSINTLDTLPHFPFLSPLSCIKPFYFSLVRVQLFPNDRAAFSVDPESTD